jgi:hypothetical protein
VPFDYELVPVDRLGDREGWLAGRVQERGEEVVRMMRIDWCSPTQIATARRAAVRHECPEWLASLAGRAPASRAAR